MSVHYLTRDEWGAGPIGAGHAVPHSQFTGLAVHHTVMVMPDYDRDGFLHGDLDDIKRYMRQLQVARPDLGIEVPYSFVVFRGARDSDCVVAEGRGWGRTGAHTSGQNSSRYGVAYAGNASVDPATPGVIDGVRWVGAHLANPAGARPTIGHRDVKPTECPGHNLYARLGELQPPFTRTPAAPPTPVASEEDAVHTIQTAGQPVRLVVGGVVIGFPDQGTSDRVLAAYRKAGVLTTKPVVFEHKADHDLVLDRLIAQHELDAILAAASTTQLGESMVDVDAIRKNLGAGDGNVLRAPLVDIVREALRLADTGS